MSNNCRQHDFFCGAFIGGALAALGVLLFTTKKGKQLQRNFKDACEDVKETLYQVRDQVEDFVEETVEDVEKLGKKAAHKAKDLHHK